MASRAEWTKWLQDSLMKPVNTLLITLPAALFPALEINTDDLDGNRQQDEHNTGAGFRRH